MTQKTEQPTHKRLQDARKAGQVVKSREVTQGAQLFAATIWFWLEGPKLIDALKDACNQTIQSMTLPLEQAFTRTLLVCAQSLTRFIGSLAVVVALVAVLSGIAQTGLVFAPKRLMPKLDTLNPVHNAKNLFSLKKLYGLWQNIFKVLLLGGVFAYILSQYGQTLIYLPQCGVHCAIPTVARFCSWLLGCLIGFYIVFAAADYLFERYQLMKQLRMSKQDIQQELKDIWGNPALKQRIRETHKEIQHSDLPSRVARSTVVISNPTHLAICLYYKQSETPLPVVTEKSAGYNALRVIEIARSCRVPVVTHVALARQLMTETKIGDVIPEKLFEPVAEVLRVVMLELDGKD